MEEQTVIPEVSEIQARELKDKIVETKEEFSKLLTGFTCGEGIDSVTNCLISLRMCVAAMQGVKDLNKQSKGLGEVRLNRSRFKDVEKANVKSFAIIETEDKERRQVSKSTTKRDIMTDKFPPVDWSKVN